MPVYLYPYRLLQHCILRHRGPQWPWGHHAGQQHQGRDAKGTPDAALKPYPAFHMVFIFACFECKVFFASEQGCKLLVCCKLLPCAVGGLVHVVAVQCSWHKRYGCFTRICICMHCNLVLAHIVCPFVAAR